MRRSPLRSDAAECRCGHPRTAHRHLRRGSECSLCPGTCPRFRLRLGSLLRRSADDGNDSPP